MQPPLEEPSKTATKFERIALAMSDWLARAQKAAVKVAEAEGEDPIRVKQNQEAAAAQHKAAERELTTASARKLEETFATAAEWVDALRSAINEEEQRLQAERSAVEKERETGLSAVEAARSVLEAERAAYEAEKQRVAALTGGLSSIVKLNVGGEEVETLRSTFLSQRGSLLESMFSGKHPVETDQSGRYFLDRDPETFKLLISFMRSPDQFSLLGLSAREVAMLKAEFAYFQMEWTLE